MQQSRSFFVSGDVSLPQEHYHIMSISVCSGQCFIFLCFSYLTYSDVVHIHLPVQEIYMYLYICGACLHLFPTFMAISLGHSCTWLIWYFCLSLPLYIVGLCDQTVNYSIFSVFCGFCLLDAYNVSLSNWLTVDRGCHIMTVFEICVKVPYMYTWGLNFHHQHPQVI